MLTIRPLTNDWNSTRHYAIIASKLLAGAPKNEAGNQTVIAVAAFAP